jgi:hypothetical protein
MRARCVVEVRLGSRVAIGAAPNDASLRFVGMEWSSQLRFVALAAKSVNGRPWKCNCVLGGWTVAQCATLGPMILDGDGGVHELPSNE